MFRPNPNHEPNHEPREFKMALLFTAGVAFGASLVSVPVALADLFSIELPRAIIAAITAASGPANISISLIIVALSIVAVRRRS